MGKKIMILNGSPRKNGNTSCLIDSFVKGTETAGHSVTRFDLQQMKIAPCTGCGRGGGIKESPCTQKDDMDDLSSLSRIERACACNACLRMGYVGTA